MMGGFFCCFYLGFDRNEDENEDENEEGVVLLGVVCDGIYAWVGRMVLLLFLDGNQGLSRLVF